MILWIAVTPGDDENTSAVPQSVRTLASDLAAAQVFAEENAPTRDAFDLSREKAIVVYSTGTTMTLYGNAPVYNPNPINPATNTRYEDFYYDTADNELKLTDYGRKKNL